MNTQATVNIGDIALIPVVSMKYPTIGEETGKYRLGVVTKLDGTHVGWVELNGEPHRHFGGECFIVPKQDLDIPGLLRAAHQARKNNLWELEEAKEFIREYAR
jgi:hypothetical protein